MAAVSEGVGVTEIDVRCVVARHAPSDDPRQLTQAFGLSPAPVIVVCGGLESLSRSQQDTARALVGPAIAVAARSRGAIVLDGSLAANGSRLLPRARVEYPGAISTLIGVASTPSVDQSQAAGTGAGFTHLVTLEEDDAKELRLLEIAESLAGELPVVMLVVGGGDATLRQAEGAAQRDWPLFMLADTGGVAARIAAARAAPGRVKDPTMRTVASHRHVTAIKTGDPLDLGQRLGWVLHPDRVLKEAWTLFASYDAAARTLRRNFELTQNTLLVGGVTATLLALLQQAVHVRALHWAVLVAPLALGALIAFAGRRAAGKRWVAVRAAAESVKSEIYRYRTQLSTYADSRLSGHDPALRPQLLATRLNKIEERLMTTEASSGAIRPYAGRLPPLVFSADGDDDGLSVLAPDEYVERRVSSQISYYKRRVETLERRRMAMQVIAVVASAAGALVAAAGAETWVALTTALGAAPLSYLAYLQIDNTIVAYNRSSTRLEGITRVWLARPAASRTSQACSRFITAAEAALTTELSTWADEMNEALRELQDRQQRQEDADEAK